MPRKDALSGGDKQINTMVYLFYHQPDCATIGKFTSAASMDVEKTTYTHATSLGITLPTASHRQSLRQCHHHILRHSGQGSYVFSNLDPDRLVGLTEEKQPIGNEKTLIRETDAGLRDLGMRHCNLGS